MSERCGFSAVGVVLVLIEENVLEISKRKRVFPIDLNVNGRSIVRIIRFLAATFHQTEKGQKAIAFCIISLFLRGWIYVHISHSSIL